MFSCVIHHSINETFFWSIVKPSAAIKLFFFVALHTTNSHHYAVTSTSNIPIVMNNNFHIKCIWRLYWLSHAAVYGKPPSGSGSKMAWSPGPGSENVIIWLQTKQTFLVSLHFSGPSASLTLSFALILCVSESSAGGGKALHPS